MLPPIAPDQVTFNVIGNTRCIRLKDDANYDNIIFHKSLSTMKLFELVRGSMEGEQLHDTECEPIYDLSSVIIELIQGITIEGNRECLFGKIKLYACAKYGSRRVPRFDFVHVSIDNNESQPAQILALLKVTPTTADLNKSNWLAIVQYLCVDSTSAKKCHFSKYKWEERIISRRRMFFIDIISIESILDHAFMIPDFETEPICGNPANSDRFWMIPRDFCDRSGWDNITSIIPSPAPLDPISLSTSNGGSDDVELYDEEDRSSCCPSLFGGSDCSSSNGASSDDDSSNT